MKRVYGLLSTVTKIIIIIIIIIIILTAIELTPGGSSTVHIYTQTVHKIQRTEHT
jgi:lipopolysaccharide/colanic/teichoic acid biosynthesis glycosyltransferase